MAFEIPADLHPDVLPLAWLVGTWHGSGRTEYPGIEPFTFEQEIAFAHDSRAFLHYFSRSWTTDESGERQGPGALETGFLRPAGPAPAEEGEESPGLGVELVLAHPTGYAEIWYGLAEAGRLTLATDLVARTVTAQEYSAGQRMYGLVEGDLLYAYDIAAGGENLQSHSWGRLVRA